MGKRIRSKCKFSDFRLFIWKLTKFLMSFFKPQISFLLHFASPFCVMIHNSSVIFWLKHMRWTKRAHQCIIFKTFECSNLKSSNSSCHSWNHKPNSKFAPLFSVMKDNPSVFFSSNLIYTLDKNRPSKWNFRTFEWLGENSENSSCHIWNYKSVFL